MEYTNYNEPEKQGSVLTGLLGALLGALIGAAVWAFAALVLNIISALIGFLIGILAAKGYDLLKGRPGVPKLICVILAIILGVVVGTAVTYGWIFHGEYMDKIADLTQTRIDDFPELDYWGKLFTIYQGDILSNLGQGLLFAALGCFDLFRGLMAKPSAATAAAPGEPSVPDLSSAQVPQQAIAAPSDNDPAQ